MLTTLKQLKSFKIFAQNTPADLWLWTPVLFAFGAIFFFNFGCGFEENFLPILAILLSAIFLALIFNSSWHFLVFTGCALFLAGSFYAFFYEKVFIKSQEIHSKVYVDGIGKISEIKKFYNSANHAEGVNFVISDVIIQPAKSSAKTVKVKKTKKKKVKKPHKKKSVEANAAHPRKNHNTTKISPTRSYKKRTKKPKKTAWEKRYKSIEKNFINLSGYQEIDRKFLDDQKLYNVDFTNHKTLHLNKISVSGNGDFSYLKVGDVVALRMMLEPPKRAEFEEDFDPILDAKIKKIFAQGFLSGKIVKLENAGKSGIDDWFENLRQKIRHKIFTHLQGDNAAIATTLLIGGQEKISQEIITRIRNCGLAHLLSISGFHLSLAGGIFFVAIRSLLARNEYLALHFDLKKIAALSAIFATFFYLKIAGTPIPAQRAFVMILLSSLALFVSEKPNAKRILMTAFLTLILLNPYALFSLSFQLSFASILVLVSIYSELMKTPHDKYSQTKWKKFCRYFYGIILSSFFIQIATFPFLLKSFGNIALLGFIANVAAIPLAAFIIMPLGFLSLFLMLFNLEGSTLLLMSYSIDWLIKIAQFVSDLPYSSIILPHLPNYSLAIATIGLFLICLSHGMFRILGIMVFCSTFLATNHIAKPDLIFDHKQKFFAFYDQQEGLFFSEKLKPSKQREHWLKHFGEEKFRTFSDKKDNQKIFFCDERKCEVHHKNKRILVLLRRNKTKGICSEKFDAIVNLTKKYELPPCVNKSSKIINNFDFLNSGTQKIFLNSLP